jgi:hypothetical protein
VVLVCVLLPLVAVQVVALLLLLLLPSLLVLPLPPLLVLPCKPVLPGSQEQDAPEHITAKVQASHQMSCSHQPSAAVAPKMHRTGTHLKQEPLPQGSSNYKRNNLWQGPKQEPAWSRKPK